MSYIGVEPADIGAYTSQSFNGGGTSFTLPRSATTASVLLFIDGVRQTPSDAYSVSGVTLTTTASTPSGTNNVTVVLLGNIVDIGTPSDGSVTLVKLDTTGTASSITVLKGDMSWGTVGAQGAGGDQVFYENDQSVDNAYTISTNKSAVSAGPVTLNATVTIPSGSRWVIV